MGKKTKAELKEDLKAAKEELTVAKTEKRDFEKSNKMAKDTDHSEDAKHGKKWKRLNDMVAKKESAVEKIKADIAEAKPEKTERASKYEYPADVVTAADKKKYRAAARAAKAKAEKGGDDAPKAKKKKEKVSDAPVEETAAPEKKKKKAKKVVDKAED